jgi:hypothetical protein
MGQQQQVNLKIKGLYTAPNDFSGVPDGALEVADDVNIDYENLGEPRRGFDAIPQSIGTSGQRVNRFASYQGMQVVHYGTNSLAYYNGSGWTTYSGTYDHPDAQLGRLRFVQANQNLYFSTSVGIKKLDVYTGTPVAAGVPKALDLQVALTGSSGFLGTNQVASVTATTTSASPNLTKISSIGSITAGLYVFGTGIPSGTTVSSITSSATVLVTTGDTAAGSTSMTNVPVSAGLAVGNLVTGNGVLTGTRITAITGAGPYTVTLSQNAIQTITGATYTFATDPTITMSQNASASATVTVVFSSGSQVGYRTLFGIRDANNNVLYGAPSQFQSVTNTTGATSNTQVTFTIPTGITTAHFYQIYRSSQTPTASVTPSDEEQLVYEGNPTAGDLTNGFIQVTDLTPDSLRGATLYTSVSQEGISQQNEQPPYCKDFCSFKGFNIYGNVRSKQRLKLTVTGVGSPNGLQVADTITIGGIVYTGAASEVIATGNFQVFTTGTPAQNIANTVNSLIKVINRYASNTAYYGILLSGPTDLPGQILLEERGVGGTAFTAIASAHGTAYTPNLPTSGSTVISKQDTYKNGLIIAKSGQPEAAPFINLLFAGDASQELLRVIPLREYVVILKQDGIFRLTGTSLSTMQVTPFDLTTKLIAPDSAAALSNEVWGYFDQGICSISDTGVNVKSRPIETDLRVLLAAAQTTIQKISFGVGYETDRKYILSLPATAADTVCQFQYVFNTFTNAWFRWRRSTSSGFIDPTVNKLYFGNGNSNTVSVERKSNTYTDYVDEGFAVTISASSVYAVTLASVTGVSVGDVLTQSGSFSVILAVDPSTNIVTVQDKVVWANAAAIVYPAIQSVIQWKPAVAGNPGSQRQYSEGNCIFKSTRFYNATLSFYSDLSQSSEDTPITGFSLATWGGFPWGTQPWGGVNKPRPVRFLVPQNKQVCSQLSVSLTIRSGYSAWKLEGIAIGYNNIGQEVG